MQLLDQIPSYDTHKIAVLYVGEGQVRPGASTLAVGLVAEWPCMLMNLRAGDRDEAVWVGLVGGWQPLLGRIGTACDRIQGWLQW